MHAVFTRAERRYLEARQLYGIARALPDAAPQWVEAAHAEYLAAIAALKVENDRKTELTRCAS